MQVALRGWSQELLQVLDFTGEEPVNRSIRGTYSQTGIEIAATQVQVNRHDGRLASVSLGQTEGQISGYDCFAYTALATGNGDGAVVCKFHRTTPETDRMLAHKGARKKADSRPSSWEKGPSERSGFPLE